MATTAILIDEICERVGTSKTAPVHFSRAMVASWLSEAQRTLARAGPVLKSCFKGSSQANVEITSLPVPDFFKICRVDVRRTGLSRKLTPIPLAQRPADRTSHAGDIPIGYLVWAGVDGSGNAKNGLMFDKNFGTGGTDDLFIWIRQVPKDCVDAGQNPEVAPVWQDGMKDYAEMMARGRMAAMDPHQVTLAKMAELRWLAAKDQAENTADPEYEDEPITVHDVMGVLDTESW